MIMQMHKSFLIIALLGLSGCGRLIDWGKELAPQAPSFKQDFTVARDSVRSVTAYDQLSTAAMFDVLWLSDDVRSAYVRLFVDRRGKSEEQYATIVRRQLEENNFVIAFYVLCPFEITLGDSDADWMAFLRVNDKKYTPIEAKVVDIAPEYRALFDKKFNRFKQVYFIKFDARDANDAAIITPTTKKLTLVFRSLRKDLEVSWDLTKMAARSAKPQTVSLAVEPGTSASSVPNVTKSISAVTESASVLDKKVTPVSVPVVSVPTIPNVKG